jgi:hypothetical protein
MAGRWVSFDVGGMMGCSLRLCRTDNDYSAMRDFSA